MGFSVSGATAILFLGMFISFGIAYSSVNNGFERVHDAYGQRTDDALFRQNTALNITRATVANTGGQLSLTVNVANNGTTALSVEDTDILINGKYQKHSDMTLSVDGNSGTDLWLPGETLRFTVTVSSKTPQVKVVTEPGVAAETEAEVV